MMRLNKYQKAWLEALRSGKYRQGKNALRIKGSRANVRDQYCCLGVLHEVCGGKWGDAVSIPMNAWKDNRLIEKSIKRYPIVETPENPCDDANGAEIWPAEKDIVKAKIDSEFMAVLAQRNDDGRSFKEIADLIESYWKTGQMHGQEP
jgi:hypothetical protein